MKPTLSSLNPALRPLTPAQAKHAVGGTTLNVGPRFTPVKVTFLERR